MNIGVRVRGVRMVRGLILFLFDVFTFKLLSGRALTCCGFTVSGSISLPSPGFFSPFPHGTSALSVVSRI